jgi:hypothetical protein
MLSETFAHLLLSKFQCITRPAKHLSLLAPRVSLVRDKPGFQLQIHTDRRISALKLLIYLRLDGPEMATELYRPKVGAEVHEVGSWPASNFNKVRGVSIDAGAALGIRRAGNSFHGVNQGRPIESARDLLIYSLRWKEPSEKHGVLERFQRIYRGNFDRPLIKFHERHMPRDISERLTLS